MTKHEYADVHLETEKGFPISRREYRLLRALLPLRGFVFEKKSLITDFVLPCAHETTKRVRMEQVLKAADGATGLTCYRCFKMHPIKGHRGRHIRLERERTIGPREAVEFIVGTIAEFGAPIPYYSKKRWHFTGVYQGLQITIALDRAFGLGKYSGFYMEIETILPVESKAAPHALSVISDLAVELLGSHRPTKISYRRMLMRTWGQGKSLKPRKLRKAQHRYRKLMKEVSLIGRRGENEKAS